MIPVFTYGLIASCVRVYIQIVFTLFATCRGSRKSELVFDLNRLSQRLLTGQSKLYVLRDRVGLN